MNTIDINEVKDLTFYMGDKTTDELWGIIREACRVKTSTWRAYEELRSHYQRTIFVDGEHQMVDKSEVGKILKRQKKKKSKK